MNELMPGEKHQTFKKLIIKTKKILTKTGK